MPEFLVRREVFMRFIERPIGKTKFHDLVNRGLVLKVKDLHGYYRLNASLSRLGLREVSEVPNTPEVRSLEDIARLAFTMIDPVTFPSPPWLLAVDVVDVRDLDHAERLVAEHREHVEALEIAAEKLVYFAGVLDAQVKLVSEGE